MTMRFFFSLCVLSLAIGPALSGEIDFNRDIRPILSDRCYFCHGPDEANREADLRLDSRSDAAYVLDSDELIERITSDDSDLRMPPPHSKLSMNDQEIQLIKEWIAQGARYDAHWSFVPLPEKVAVPNVTDHEWSKRTLDRFVLARMEQSKLTPSSPADPLRWLRRVSFDLTGLPPSVELIERFKKMIGRLSNEQEIAGCFRVGG